MLLRKFMKNEKGNVALMFAGSMIAICGVVGVSVDYARLMSTKNDAQNVLDASLLAAATEYQKTGDKQKAKKVGRKHMTASIPDIKKDKLKIVIKDKYFSGTYNDEIENTFLSVFVAPKSSWGIESRIKVPTKSTTDFALAVDVSNSLEKSGQLAGLHKSLAQFSTRVFKNSKNGEVSVSVVPFANAVSFESSYKKWLDSTDGYSQTTNFNGCFEYENIGSKDLLSTAGNSNRIAAFDRRKHPKNENLPFCPETSSDVAFYLNDENTLSKMTKNLTTAQGTNTADGLTWAWRTLSNDWQKVFNESTKYPRVASSSHKKVIILLTDGVPYAVPSVKGKNLTKKEINDAASVEFNEVCKQIIAAGDIDLYSIVYGTKMNETQSQDIHECIAGEGKTFSGTNEEELTSILSTIVALNNQLALSR